MKEKYLKLFLAVLLSVVFIGFGAGVSLPEVKTGDFWAEIGGSVSNWNDFIAGGGSGYTNSGPWYTYPSETPQRDPWGGLNPVPTWVNQWYYDDPLLPDHWKKVILNFNYGLNNPNANGGALIVINWSTDAWSDETAPPMMNRDPQDPNVPLIGRAEVGSLWLEGFPEQGNGSVLPFSGTYDLRDYGVDYNPVWISIDVSGYNLNLSSQSVPGSITHECIPTPEPATMLFLVLGLLGIAGVRRKVRK